MKTTIICQLCERNFTEYQIFEIICNIFLIFSIFMLILPVSSKSRW
ncbi:hypothetical protein CLOM621_06237 [Clostridium sp. M62/1]|nr:hypothetical protein CLOM621_06237 [Clostridium sp. M62/1]